MAARPTATRVPRCRRAPTGCSCTRDFGFDDARAAGAVPRPARGLAPVPLAGAAGGARLPARLRRRRPQPGLRRARRRRGRSSELAEAAHAHGLGLVVDVVPNHMALVAPEHLNAPAVGGAAARPGGADGALVRRRLGPHRRAVPVAAARRAARRDPGGGELRARHLRPEGADGRSRCCATTTTSSRSRPAPCPTRGDPATPRHGRRARRARAPALPAGVAGATRTRCWPTGGSSTSTPWSRVRVELPDVFDATHALLVDLYRARRRRRLPRSTIPTAWPTRRATSTGCATRPLRRPAAGRPGWWWRRSWRATSSCRAAWACAGTTGYDALRAVQQALVPPTQRGAGAGRGPTPTAAREPGRRSQERAKREVVERAAAARAAPADPGGGAAPRRRRRAASTPARLAEALTELLVQVDVYRCYVRPGHPVDAGAAERLGARRRAGARRPARPDRRAGALERLLLDAATTSPAGRDLVVRFQQTCGPVMAKGVEDTTFYRWHELVGAGRGRRRPGRARRPERERTCTPGPAGRRPGTRPA